MARCVLLAGLLLLLIAVASAKVVCTEGGARARGKYLYEFGSPPSDRETVTLKAAEGHSIVGTPRKDSGMLTPTQRTQPQSQ